jgi:soluble lytic murein transglycosylase-like protein
MSELLLIFATVTQSFTLPVGLLSSICYVESRHQVKAININDGGANSLGICQIKLDTAKAIGYKGTAKDLHHSPFLNAFYAGKYLKKQLNRYDNDIVKAIAAYNAGKCRFNAKGLVMNRKYVQKVMNEWVNHK